MNLWLFSIGIQPLTIEDLKKGNVPSYGGTSIDEVVEHIVKTKATSVVIITDGEVGPIPKEHAKYCKNKVWIAKLDIKIDPKRGSGAPF